MVNAQEKKVTISEGEGKTDLNMVKKFLLFIVSQATSSTIKWYTIKVVSPEARYEYGYEELPVESK